MVNNQLLFNLELYVISEQLGFTITGGTDNQIIPGDNGIYITKVLEGGPVALDGRITIGDRLTGIRTENGGNFSFDNCTHHQAVEALNICKESPSVTILVQKNFPRQVSSILDLQ